MLDAWGAIDSFSSATNGCSRERAEYPTPGEQVREPYVDRDGKDVGELRLPEERFRQAILTMNRYGWRPAIHITGDRTLDIVLDAYEAADRERSIKDKRWVVEHIPLVHPDQIQRMKRLGVVVSAQFQPYGSADAMLRRLGRERTERAVPMRDLLDAGLVVSGGSDWPGAPNNPFVNIYYYVTRNTLRAGPVGVAQKISRLEALRVMTLNNAYLTFEERIKGSIETGKLADFVVLSDDLLTVPEDRILVTRSHALRRPKSGARRVFSSRFPEATRRQPAAVRRYTGRLDSCPVLVARNRTVAVSGQGAFNAGANKRKLRCRRKRGRRIGGCCQLGRGVHRSVEKVHRDRAARRQPCEEP